MRRLAAISAELWRVASERHLGLIAAGVAFFAMLAIFPAVAALVALFGFWADPAVIDTQLDLMSEFIPPDAFALLDAQVNRLIALNDSTLGWTTALSLLVALWSARLGVAALVQGLNAVHGVQNRAGLWHLAIAVLLTGAMIAVALVALATMLILPVVLAFFPLGGFYGTAAEILRWALALMVVLGGLSVFYRYGPNRNGPRGSWLSPGLFFALLLWATASFGFSYFLSNFGNYNEVYGSIGAVIALLMWLYISAYAVLLGAALNAVLESRLPRGGAGQ